MQISGKRPQLVSGNAKSGQPLAKSSLSTDNASVSAAANSDSAIANDSKTKDVFDATPGKESDGFYRPRSLSVKEMLSLVSVGTAAAAGALAGGPIGSLVGLAAGFSCGGIFNDEDGFLGRTAMAIGLMTAASYAGSHASSPAGLGLTAVAVLAAGLGLRAVKGVVKHFSKRALDSSIKGGDAAALARTSISSLKLDKVQYAGRELLQLQRTDKDRFSVEPHQFLVGKDDQGLWQPVTEFADSLTCAQTNKNLGIWTDRDSSDNSQGQVKKRDGIIDPGEVESVSKWQKNHNFTSNAGSSAFYDNYVDHKIAGVALDASDSNAPVLKGIFELRNRSERWVAG